MTVMNRMYKDIETGEIVMESELFEIYSEDKTLQKEYQSFGEYLSNCQTFRGGTLEQVPA